MTERFKLVNWAEQLNKAHVLVIGDVMLDHFVYGMVSRISPEAPVPVLKYGDRRSALGGAGNVVQNLLALGSKVSFVSVVGDDLEGLEIKEILSGFNAMEFNLIVDQTRKTTVKTRFIADRQQVLRVDSETTHRLENHSREKALQSISDFTKRCDVIVLSDYAKGFLEDEIIRGIIDIGKKNDKPVLVDPKGKDFIRYKGASVLTPNLKELGEATHLQMNSNETIVDAAKYIVDSCELEAVLATRSQEGMSLVQSSGKVSHLKAETKEVFDVSGAGDTVIAVLAAAFGAGASLYEAAALANVAAGIVVSKVGTAVTYSRDLINALHLQELSFAEAKVLELYPAMDRIELWRRKGYIIGFTNGVFDLLHPGHISLMSQAAEKCDRLIVGLNGDTSVRRLTGGDPVQQEAARSAILASLEVVDMVVIFQDETPIPLLSALRPDVLIKGGNYKPEEVVGADLVRSYGGEIVLADIVDIYKANSKIAQMTNGTL